MLVLCSFASAAGDVSTSPLAIEPQVLDFGRVNESEHVLELSFTIKNVSDAPVQIANIGSGCGCTAVKLSQPTLKVGASISVPVKVTVQGQRGNFGKNVQLDIVGYKESIVVPIRGKVVQDIWFEGLMVQCFAKESETTVEKTFEVRTVDFPSVQFDWKLVDEAILIEEISRVKEDDETIITLRLKMEAPLGQATTSRHLVLVPLDRNIKQLVIPVVAYRSSLQSNRLLEMLRNKNAENRQIVKKAPELHPKLINLGLIPYGEYRRFDITGPPELLGSLEIAGHEQLPLGTNVTLHYGGDLDADVLSVTICVGESLRSGLVKGIIRLQSPQGDEFSIDIIGLIGPKK
jgi:hypothetical protein